MQSRLQGVMDLKFIFFDHVWTSSSSSLRTGNHLRGPASASADADGLSDRAGSVSGCRRLRLRAATPAVLGVSGSGRLHATPSDHCDPN